MPNSTSDEGLCPLQGYCSQSYGGKSSGSPVGCTWYFLSWHRSFGLSRSSRALYQNRTALWVSLRHRSSTLTPLLSDGPEGLHVGKDLSNPRGPERQQCGIQDAPGYLISIASPMNGVMKHSRTLFSLAHSSFFCPLLFPCWVVTRWWSSAL